MSLITNKQQELIDQLIEEYISTYDKVSQAYLHVRKQIIGLAGQISDPTPTLPVEIEKLRYELDIIWQAYSKYLESLDKRLEIASSISPHYVEALNKQYEKLLVSKLSLTKTVKNIKEVQIPLINEMKALIDVLHKSLGRNTRRYNSKSAVEAALKQPYADSMDIKALVFTRDELYGLFDKLDDAIQQLQTTDLATHPIGSSYYIDKELETGDKFIDMSDNQYFFKVHKLNFQDKYLESATVSKYEEMNQQLVRDITDLMGSIEASKKSWSENALKVDEIEAIVNGRADS